MVLADLGTARGCKWGTIPNGGGLEYRWSNIQYDLLGYVEGVATI